MVTSNRERSALLAVLWLPFFAACSTSTPSGDAAIQPDSPADDRAIDAIEDAVADATPADQGIDVPKVPARWEEIAGGPQVYNHEAVLLADGRVLIVGGEYQVPTGNGNEYTYEFLTDTFLYDPDQNAFALAGKLATGRTYHAVVALDDGRALVTGGESPDYEKTTEIFDPKAPASSAWSAGPDMPGLRSGHTLTKLSDGRLLAAGGFGGVDSVSAAILFDPESTSWQVLMSTMNVARRFHSATLLANGKVVIAGGYLGASGNPLQNTFLDSIEIFDPEKNNFSLLNATLAGNRAAHDGLLLGDGRVLFVGGFCRGASCKTDTFEHELFDPVTETVVGVAQPADFPGSAGGAVTLLDGRFMIIGGPTATKAFILDVAKGVWISAPDLLFAQWGLVATRLVDGSVLIVGGTINDEFPYVYADKAQRFYP